MDQNPLSAPADTPNPMKPHAFFDPNQAHETVPFDGVAAGDAADRFQARVRETHLSQDQDSLNL